MNENGSEKHYWLYVLKLNQGKIYIGITAQKTAESRIKQHERGFYSAQWVKKYGYLETIETKELGNITEVEAENIENELTLKYMKEFGKDNVRGGKFNYSGEYRYKFGRFIRDKDWEVITVIIFLLLVILVLTLKQIHN